MSINEMFDQSVPAKFHRLEGSAELASLAGQAAVAAIKAMEPQIEDYRERITQSFKSGEAMDKLVEELVDLDQLVVEASFLQELSEETIDSILKSVQSKRSRLRSKAATLDTYRAMMTAAVSESVLRKACDRPKSYIVHRSGTHSIDYTPAELEAFAEDQEALKKAIRNVQSKKSIYKHREDFSESDEYWVRLLKVEQQLKDLRIGGHSSTLIEVDRTKDALASLLNGVDIQHLKAADSKELLEHISTLLNEEAAVETEETFDDVTEPVED